MARDTIVDEMTLQTIESFSKKKKYLQMQRTNLWLPVAGQGGKTGSGLRGLYKISYKYILYNVGNIVNIL